MAAFGLPRSARLLTRRDFASLREQSQRLSTRNFVAEYRPSSRDCVRLGVAISRRVSKLAVVRNRIRRTIRESFRLHRADLPHLDILLIARSLSAQQTNPHLRADLEGIWRKLSAAHATAALNE
ncbi:MAG TPA: ribonuclease P protein component [Rudaea sp.]|jgi:ribonuclease P protein component|nr:ribonuclease P protein component [Rudaea sp.]